jgi:hypothetical protein
MSGTATPEEQNRTTDLDLCYILYMHQLVLFGMLNQYFRQIPPSSLPFLASKLWKNQHTLILHVTTLFYHVSVKQRQMPPSAFRGP